MSLDLLAATGRIHPALSVHPAGVVVGIVDEVGEYRLISSERTLHTPDRMKDQLLFVPRPYADLAGRWPGDDWNAFLNQQAAPSFSEILALTISTLDQAMEFPRPEYKALIATWVVATYFFPVFLTFPRLNLSGERESGKSKLLSLIRAMAWNALLMLNPTPAVLYRLVHEFRPTLLLDEVEGLNQDDGREVLAIINSGYKAGGSVPRCEGEKTKRVELFNVFSPLALAAIKALNPTTEDRSIPLTLQRSADPSRLNAEVDLNAPVFARIRSGGYQLLLTRWGEVQETYRTLALPSWLNGRARELWKPLLTLAAVGDRENGLQITPDLRAVAREHVRDRQGISAEGEALLTVLTDQLSLGLDSVTVRPRDLRERLREHLGWRDAPSSEACGAWLRRFGFKRAGRDREGARYDVNRSRLSDLSARYAHWDEAEP